MNSMDRHDSTLRGERQTVGAHQVEWHLAEITMAYPAIRFEDTPSQNDGDSDGGFVCFMCGRSMDRGEPFICVSRRLEAFEDREGTRRVIDAMASLQVCRRCTFLSAHHELRWAHKPKLTELEIWGFHIYARLLADAVARAKSDTRVEEVLARAFVADVSYFSITLDAVALLGGAYKANRISTITARQCRNCHDTVDFNKPHLVIEITTDRPTSNGITQSNVMPLGRYCNKCSRKLFAVFDTGFVRYDL